MRVIGGNGNAMVFFGHDHRSWSSTVTVLKLIVVFQTIRILWKWHPMKRYKIGMGQISHRESVQ